MAAPESPLDPPAGPSEAPKINVPAPAKTAADYAIDKSQIPRYVLLEHDTAWMVTNVVLSLFTSSSFSSISALDSCLLIVKVCRVFFS